MKHLSSLVGSAPSRMPGAAPAQACPPTHGGQPLDASTRAFVEPRFGHEPQSMWGLSDGPAAFLDMHRTRAPESLLEGTGVSSCSVVCEQTYGCDHTQATAGTFRMTRNYQAGTHQPPGGAPVHITTGTVIKT